MTRVEVRGVGAVHLGGDPQPPARSPRDLDRAVDPLLGRDAPEEREVPAGPGSRTVAPRSAGRGGTVASHATSGSGRRCASRDRDDRNVASTRGRAARDPEDRAARAASSGAGRVLSATRIVEVVDVEVDHVELARALRRPSRSGPGGAQGDPRRRSPDAARAGSPARAGRGSPNRRSRRASRRAPRARAPRSGRRRPAPFPRRASAEHSRRAVRPGQSAAGARSSPRDSTGEGWP